MFALLAAVLAMLVGLWKVTSPEPSQVEREAGLTARKLSRAAIWTTMILFPIEGFVADYSPTAGIVVQAAVLLVVCVGAIALFRYAEQIAMRIPDLQLAKSTRRVMVGTAATIVAAGTASALTVMNPVAVAVARIGGLSGSGVTGIARVIVYLDALGSIGGLIFEIWSLRLVDWFRKALREAARMAKASWAGEAATPHGGLKS
jgi:hypothetical protein